MQHHIHKAYISIELLLAVIVLGVGFNFFWRFYQSEWQNQVFLDKDNEEFLAQTLINDKIYKKDFEKDFTLVSENGIVYKGKLAEIQTKNRIYYCYFSTQAIIESSSSK